MTEYMRSSSLKDLGDGRAEIHLIIHYRKGQFSEHRETGERLAMNKKERSFYDRRTRLGKLTTFADAR